MPPPARTIRPPPVHGASIPAPLSAAARAGPALAAADSIAAPATKSRRPTASRSIMPGSLHRLPCRDACRGVGPNIAPEEGNVIHVKIAARQALDEEAAARDDPQDAPIAPCGQRTRNRGGQRPFGQDRKRVG